MSKKYFENPELKYLDEIQKVTWDTQNRICLNGMPLLHTGDISLVSIPGTTAKLLNITLIVELLENK